MSVNLGENKISDVFKLEQGSAGGTNDYNELDNKPQINGVTLQGNKTSADLGIVTGPTDVYTKQETNTLIDTKIAEAGATKADTSYVNEQLNLKADKSAVDLALASKANVDDVYTKEETTSAINSAITGKADASYVNEQLNLKADKATTYTKEEVNTAISDLEASVNTKLNTKADKTDTYTKSETVQAIQSNTTNKADTSYVNEQLALKADKSDTYTKEEVDDMFDNPTITGDTLPIGSITPYSGISTPSNWLLCDGREVSRETYSQLFAIIGTSYGAGDGSTTFNLPNLTFTGVEIDNYIIKAKQSAGVIATVVDTLESSSTTDALSANMGKKLANMGKKLESVTLFETDKTYSNVKTGTVITLKENITNYKRIKVYGISNKNNLTYIELFNPSVNDIFSLNYFSNGDRSGEYAFSIIFRNFIIQSNKQIRYDTGTSLSSRITSNNNLHGYVGDVQTIKIYQILGYK